MHEGHGFQTCFAVDECEERVTKKMEIKFERDERSKNIGFLTGLTLDHFEQRMIHKKHCLLQSFLIFEKCWKRLISTVHKFWEDV